MGYFNKYKRRQWHILVMAAGLICIIAMLTPITAFAQTPFFYSEMRNHIMIQIRLGPNAQTAAEQLIGDLNDEIGDDILYLTPLPTAYIIFRDQYNIRRHDRKEEGEIIGSGHSIGPMLVLLVSDDDSGTGYSVVELASFSTNPGSFSYLDELEIKEIPEGKTADELVCQVWRKLEMLTPGGTEKFQHEWHIKSDEVGEIEFRIKFERQEPTYTAQGHPGDGYFPYLGFRFRSDPNRLISIERRGTLYPLHTSLVRFNFEMNDPIVDAIYGDSENEVVSATQGFLEYYLKEEDSQF